MSLEGFTPAQVARLDQERQDIKVTLQSAIDSIRQYRQSNPDTAVDELWVALVQEFARLERVRLLSLFTEAVVRLAQDGDIW